MGSTSFVNISAVITAAVPLVLPERAMVGTEVYPEPPLVIYTVAMAPLATVYVPANPLPAPPVAVRVPLPE